MYKSFVIAQFGGNSSSYRRVRRAWRCLSRTKECAEFGGSLFEPTSVRHWGVFSRTDIIASLLSPWLTEGFPSGFPDLLFHPSRSAGPNDPAAERTHHRKSTPPNEHNTEHCYSDQSPGDDQKLNIHTTRLEIRWDQIVLCFFFSFYFCLRSSWFVVLCFGTFSSAGPVYNSAVHGKRQIQVFSITSRYGCSGDSMSEVVILLLLATGEIRSSCILRLAVCTFNWELLDKPHSLSIPDKDYNCKSIVNFKTISNLRKESPYYYP